MTGLGAELPPMADGLCDEPTLPLRPPEEVGDMSLYLALQSAAFRRTAASTTTGASQHVHDWRHNLPATAGATPVDDCPCGLYRPCPGKYEREPFMEGLACR